MSSCPVGDDFYFLTCQRYIELNPVRAGMVEDPGLYRSSYQTNALGEESILISPHAVYQTLATCDARRRQLYIALFEDIVDVTWSMT
jgi:putative transposase